MAEVVVRLHMGFLDHATGTIVVNADKVTRHYFSNSIHFLIDLVPMLPTWYLNIAYFEETLKWSEDFLDIKVTNIDDVIESDNAKFLSYIVVWMVSFAPFLPTMIFLYRAYQFFLLPPQLQVKLDVYQDLKVKCDGVC